MKKVLLLFLLTLVLLSACQTESADGGSVFKDALPESNGGRMDLIVVAKESLWQSEAGDLFREVFTAPQAGLPQPESVFTVRQVEPKSFNSLLKRSRNIVILDQGDYRYTTKKNFWAKPQIVVTLAGKDLLELNKLIQRERDNIYKMLKDQEIEVLQQKMNEAVQPNPAVLKKHNVAMRIPKAFELEVEKENLLVFWNKTQKTDQGLMIYFQPMRADIGALGTKVVPLRDSLTELYIQSEREGAYMITEDIIVPTMVNTELGGAFAIETRGLWRTVNDFKGGPFLNYTVYDEENSQIIFIDAFVFSPETKKRNFVLELEAIIRSLEIRS